MRLIVALEGVHGCGKTTVFKRLQEKRPDWNFLPEFVDLPRYPFGSRDKQLAFRAELWVLQQMLKRNRLLRKVKRGVVVCDRSPLCVLAYSYALCSEEDYQLLKEIYDAIDWDEDIIFYFEETPESVLPKIRKRQGRPREWNEDDPQYVAKIIEGYEEVLKTTGRVVIRVKNSDVEGVSSRIIHEIERRIELF
ncbi:MAG: AAA family ATPase [Candidatus Jordarchaeales archaeon]